MNFFIEKNQILLEEVLFLTEKEGRKEHYFPIHIESKQRNAGIVKDVVKSLNIRVMKNIEAAKELLEMYKSITLEQLEEDYEGSFIPLGFDILNKITGFGETTSCILCKAVHGVCVNCIYSFRMDKIIAPCIDEIYKEMEKATSAKELYNAIQKRISYLTHVIEYYETMDSKR